MSELCREYEISRKTGHKLWKRYKALGVAGLEDQSRAPKHIPHRTTSEAVEAIVAMRKRYPNWGPKKLKDVLENELGHVFPASSTIGDILRKRGFVSHRPQRHRYVSRPTGLQQTQSANDVWCADYKGRFD